MKANLYMFQVRRLRLPVVLPERPEEAHGEPRGAPVRLQHVREDVQVAEVAGGAREGAPRGAALPLPHLPGRLHVAPRPRPAREGDAQGRGAEGGEGGVGARQEQPETELLVNRRKSSTQHGCGYAPMVC